MDGWSRETGGGLVRSGRPGAAGGGALSAESRSAGGRSPVDTGTQIFLLRETFKDKRVCSVPLTAGSPHVAAADFLNHTASRPAAQTRLI